MPAGMRAGGVSPRMQTGPVKETDDDAMVSAFAFVSLDQVSGGPWFPLGQLRQCLRGADTARAVAATVGQAASWISLVHFITPWTIPRRGKIFSRTE